MKVTPKHLRFVDEYLLDLDATTAYKRAGYHAKGHAAQVNGSRLRARPEIAALIAERLKARQAQTGITEARVLSELELLAFSDLDHYVVDEETGNVKLADGAPAGAMRALQAIKRKVITRIKGPFEREVTREVEIRLWDKPGPLKLAGQHVGLFANKVEHTGHLEIDYVHVREALAGRIAGLAARLGAGRVAGDPQ